MPRMSESKTVLVTGSAGRIGRAAVRALVAAGHRVVGFDQSDRVSPPGSYVKASLTDADAILRAAVGADCVVHLAATPDDARFPRGEPPDDGDNFLSELLPSNVVGTYHVMEAARKAKVRRVVLASTGQVVDGDRNDQNVPITASVLPRPRYLYACTKVFLEAIGQVYGVQHGIEVMAVRLGWCPRDLKQVSEIAGERVFQDVYLSPGDAGRFITAAVGAEKLPAYSVVYATSRPPHTLQYDLEPARKLIGYEPQESWPAGAEEFT